MSDDFLPYQVRSLEGNGAISEPTELESVEPEQEVMTAVDGAARRWTPPNFDQGVTAASVEDVGQPIPTLESELEALKAEAYQQGFEQGLADAEEQARRMLAEQSQKLQNAMQALRQPQAIIDAQLEEELLQLTLNLAEQLLRRQITLDPALLKKMIEQATHRLPVLEKPLRIYLSPDDLQLLTELDADHAGSEDWQFIEDPAIRSGGYRIHSGNSTLDDTVEMRLNGLVQRMCDEKDAE